MKRTALILLAATTLSGGLAINATAAKAPKKASVSLKSSKFLPATVTIRKGGSVSWKWRDGSVPHDVVGPGFRSKIVKSGTFKRTFAKTGTFNYVCTLHEQMKGKVVVR